MTTQIPMPVVIDGFDELIERVRRLLDRLHRGVNQVIDNANRAARWLPGVVADRIVDLCDRFVDLCRRFYDEVLRLLGMCGKPWRLWAAGTAWVEGFSGPISGHVGEMDPVHLAAAYEWDGRAAGAYEDTTARQREALSALQLIGSETHSALGNVAVAICALWATVAAAMLVAAAEIIAAGIAAASIAGVAGAVAFAFGAIGSVLAGIGAGIAAFMLVAERANDAMVTLQQRLNDRSGVGDGWPGAAGERFRDGERWKLAE